MNFKLKRRAGTPKDTFVDEVYNVYENKNGNGYSYMVISDSGTPYYFDVKNDEVVRGHYLVSNHWEVVKLRRKRKMDQFKVGETYLCTRGTASSFTEGKLYEVLDGGYASQPFIVSDSGTKWFKSDIDGIYSEFEKVEEPKPEEITLTIKGKTFYDIRSEAEELLNLVNSIIKASEELGISDEKVKRIYGGAK